MNYFVEWAYCFTVNMDRAFLDKAKELDYE